MPSDGDAPLARFAHDIVHGDGFAFGAPVLSDDGSTVTVPVLRTRARPRRFALANEATDAVSAAETGRIDRLRVCNDSPSLLFVPSGTVFAGRQTARRGTTADLWLAPATTQDIEVRCVEPSRPIRAGDELTLADDLAPLDVTQSLLSRDQGRVWATVRPSRTAEHADLPMVSSATDRECGRVLLDAQGVVAAEIYGDPQSWSAAGRRQPTPSTTNPLGLNPANAVALVQRFIDGLPSTSFQPAGPASWVAVDVSAAYTLVGDEVVHLLAFGRDLTRTAAMAPMEGSGAGPVSGTFEGLASRWSSVEESGAEVAAATATHIEASDDAPTPAAEARPRRRKVLTTGWDAPTFASLERFSHKEHGGDRSAAIRALVRRGLRDGGYLGPTMAPPMTATAAVGAVDLSPPGEGSDTLEARIHEYERIAGTETYADWLRKRARFEVDRLRGGNPEPPLEDMAPPQPPSPAPEAPDEIPELEEIESEAPPVPPAPPVDVRPLLRRAFAASAAGRYPEALGFFGDVLTAEPDNRTALLGRAVALRRSGKAQEALEALDAVLRVDPANAAALLNQGRLLQERGDLKAALEAFDRLAAVAPNDWDVWLVRGDVLAKLGRRAEALQAYSEAVRRNPDDESLQLRIRTLENAESAQPLPPTPRIPLPRDVQEGQSYLIQEGRPALGLRVLRALAARGVPSLVMTTRAPDAVRREVGVAGVRVLELTHAPGDGRHEPTALAALSHLVGRFVQEGRGHGVITLDGLGSLIQETSSRETLLFIERVHETVLQSHAVFLVSVAPGELSDREIALLERSLRSLS